MEERRMQAADLFRRGVIPAPELNPTEQVFGNLKSSELANLCRDTIGDVGAIAETGLDRIGSDARLCFAFLRHSGLSL